MGTDTPKVSWCQQIDIIQAFVADSPFAEMKNKRGLIEKPGNFRASLEKLNVSKHLTGFWRDLDDDQSPIQRILIPIDATRVKAADSALMDVVLHSDLVRTQLL